MVDARGPSERTGTAHPEQRGPINALPIALVALAILAAVTLVLAYLLWSDDDEGLTGTQQNATVGEIADNPQEWIGENVTVSGEVNEVLTPLAYVLGGEQFVGGGELLVIGPPPAVTTDVTPDTDEGIYPQDIVQVSGEVREFNRAELEEEWGTEFPEDVFEGREGEAVLVGQSVTLTQRVRQAEADIVDTGDILNDPESYQGETVSVSDTVATAASERVFVLGDGLIVIDETGAIAETALEEGIEVEATGEITSFDQADLGDADVSEYEGNPVMQAEFIRIIGPQS